jgi:cytochrome c peroxidase
MQAFLFIIFGIVFSNLSLADPLLGLPTLSIPDDNKQSIAKIKLGRLLFNDARFSSTDSISCASCHSSDKAFTDGLKVPIGIKQLKGVRNAPTVINSAFFDTLFLDGRAKSLEDQALGPFTNPVEHGLTDYNKIINVIRSDTAYPAMFKQVFNVSTDQISMQHVTKAIASFERTLIAGNSLFDQYYFGRDHSKLSESAARGLRIFKRKGNCVTCHEISFDNALFMDNRYYNIGIGFQRLKPEVDDVISLLKQGGNIRELNLTPEQSSELGRFQVTHRLTDIGKFKTPTLRNISLTAPYMHDGSHKTLEEVIDYYDKGGNQNRFIDPAIFPLHLTQQEKDDLIEFLQALTSQQ